MFWKKKQLWNNFIVQENGWYVFHFLTIHTNWEFFRFSFMTVVYRSCAHLQQNVIFYNRPCFYLVSLTTRCLPRASIIQFLSFTRRYNTKRCTVAKICFIDRRMSTKVNIHNDRGGKQPHTCKTKLKRRTNSGATPWLSLCWIPEIRRRIVVGCRNFRHTVLFSMVFCRLGKWKRCRDRTV